MSENIKKVSLVYLILLPALILITPGFVFSQNDYQAKRSKAIDLFNQNKFIEARPLFEELAKAKPDDAEVLYDTGFLVFTYAQTLKDAEPRRQNGLKAREYLVKAQQLGVDNNILRNMLGSIGADGSIDQLKYSNDLEADKALKEGEQYFAAGDFKNAITAYQKALKLAPTLYEAALYTGDVYYKASDFEKASEWFAKAIQIDPTRETAHRYWADSLTKEGKTKEAQDKYIDAFVAEPYSNYARSAFINWAKKQSESGTSSHQISGKCFDRQR